MLFGLMSTHYHLLDCIVKHFVFLDFLFSNIFSANGACLFTKKAFREALVTENMSADSDSAT